MAAPGESAAGVTIPMQQMVPVQPSDTGSIAALAPTPAVGQVASQAVVGAVQQQSPVVESPSVVVVSSDATLYQPYKHLRHTAQTPLRAYAASCGSYCSMFILFIALIAGLGSTFLPFETSVPLYLRGDTAKMREDAIVAGQEEANLSPEIAEFQLTQSVHRYTLELIYEPKLGIDAMSPGLLEVIKGIETTIKSVENYESFCLKAWSSEQTNNVTSEAITRNEALQDSVPCAPPRSPLLPVKSWDAYDFSMPPYTLLMPDGSINETFIDVRVNHYANAAQGSIEQRSVMMYTDAKFGFGNPVSRALRSEFHFAMPLNGYKNSEDNEFEQKEKIEKWLSDNMTPLLFDAATSDLNVWFKAFHVDDPNQDVLIGPYLQTTLSSDAALALLSFLFVWVYMSLMKSSWWLATMAMGNIVLAFSPAYMLYYGVFQQRYFGTFNILSIFMILGVGADDIFVMLDTFDQSQYAGLEISSSLANRLSWTFKRAGSAMLVTSITTMASFLANSTSSFPAIYTFGIFAAMLVLVNYCAVILYYPTVMAMHERYFKDKTYCCGIFAAIEKLTSRRNRGSTPAAQAMSSLDKAKGDTASPDVEAQVVGISPVVPTAPAMGVAETWFANVFSPTIVKRRWVIIVVYALVLIIMLRFAARLEPDPNPPQMFPDGHNFVEFGPAKSKHFARGSGVYSTTQRIVFGFDPIEPIDRSGTKETNSTDLGTPNWSPTFSLWESVDCFIHLCDTVSQKDDRLRLGGGADFPVTCWAAEFKGFVVANGGTWSPSPDMFKVWMPQWILRPEVMGRYKKYMHAQASAGYQGLGVGTAPDFRFHYLEVPLTQDWRMPYQDGIDLFNDWDEWLAEKFACENCACKGLKAKAAPMQTARLSSLWFLQAKLTNEAFTSIGISLALAWIVLTIATGNFIVSSIAIFVIGSVVTSCVAFAVFNGWKLGVLESVNFVLVPGMSVDFVAHLAEAYVHSTEPTRAGKVTAMLAQVGISVVSGAVSTLGACFFLFFATITFFVKFGAFIFATIAFSLVFALCGFSAIMSIIGPEGSTGDIKAVFRKCKRS